jgi:DNA polymerase III sliding clamp (beta) subunit (PCNA family)
MKLPRQELLTALEVAKPALASKDLVEELTCLWFDGRRVTAYNDTIGISFAFESDFQGGLRGSLLLGLLDHSRARDVEITASDKESEMLVKAAGARLKLALLPPARSVFDYPEFPEDRAWVIAKEFLEALPRVMLSVGQDVSIPDQLGVTLRTQGDRLHLYATDSKTISAASIARPKGCEIRHAIIPTLFCEQLLKLCKDGGHFYVDRDTALVRSNKGVGLLGRLVNAARPIPFAETIQRYMPKDPNGSAVPVPSRLKLALERASVVLEGAPGDPLEMSFDGDFLDIYAKTPYGEIKDEIKLDREHANTRARVHPELIKRALGHASEMTLIPGCLLMLGAGGYTYLVSTMGDTEK